MKILAHRGWWHHPAEKNTKTAFRRAFENGFGVETDTRDQNGVLKIAHDMPVGDGVMDFDTFLDLYKAYARAGTIALNIKADGVWLDAFFGDWITPEVVEKHLAAGKKVALVSPELHGRDHSATWDLSRDLRGENLAICTDLPHKAAEIWT